MNGAKLAEQWGYTFVLQIPASILQALVSHLAISELSFSAVLVQLIEMTQAL